MLMRTKWYPQPHKMANTWLYELDNAAIDSTIYPIIMQDEALGSPSILETNPTNASFAVSSAPNCYYGARVNNIYGNIKINLTSKAIDDNLPSVRFAVMVIALAFKNNYTVIDDLSSVETQDVLELQTEDTDKQGYPLWNGTDMLEAAAGSADLAATVPGLTTDQQIEGVAFSETTYYDALSYLTIAGKMKSLQSGLKWYTLTPNKPFINIPIHIKSSAKTINEFTFQGVLIHVPVVDSGDQNLSTLDITAATGYVRCNVNFRYYEWHQDFDFKRF